MAKRPHVIFWIATRSEGRYGGGKLPGGWCILAQHVDAEGEVLHQGYFSGAARYTTKHRLVVFAILVGLNNLVCRSRVDVWIDEYQMFRAARKRHRRSRGTHTDLWKAVDRLALQHDVKWLRVKYPTPVLRDAYAILETALNDALTRDEWTPDTVEAALAIGRDAQSPAAPLATPDNPDE